ncbi:hypothetical protein [Serpentinimonas maccroryi]|uniref:hypothetical protein n=1 Tax=Serpentinimonas maccroryi TaxID=1458426 RepID=UPI00203387A9|nr:hypothetical protein [Serpentinimonas maccroryi]MCM2478158.1 hypothetical protein [Serpentinimonas maccroryi]
MFFSFPLGTTAVIGATGRPEVLGVVGVSLGGLVSFWGFFTILLLRCSPLGMGVS